jgi:hypothetical protein
MGLSGLRLGANDLIQRIRFGKPLEDDRAYTQQPTTPTSSLKVESPYTPVSSMTRTQGADLVTGTPGTPVNIAPTSVLNTTPGAGTSMPTVGAPTSTSAIQAQQRAAAANNITPQRTADIYNNPTTATKGNLTVINAAGEPINIDSPEYYDEEEMVTPQQNTPAVNNQPASVPQTEEPQSEQEIPETENASVTAGNPVVNNIQPAQNYFQQPNSDLQRFTDNQFTSGSGIPNYGSFNQGDVFMQQPGSNPVADEDFYNSSFSSNPYDGSMIPFNPDYEQPTEYKFGVDPLTSSSSSDIAINNPNSILNTMEGRDWFAQQTPEVQKQIIKNQTGTGVRAGARAGVRRNQQPTNNFGPRYNPASERFDPISAYWSRDIYNLKNRFNPKIDYSKNYSEDEARKLYDKALSSLYDDRNKQIKRYIGSGQPKNAAERRIYENIMSTYAEKARQIEKKNPFAQSRANGGLVRADLGINFSPVSYPTNSIVQPGGIGQGKIGPCTEDEVKDPNSPCYDPMYAGQGPRTMEQLPTQAQLKLKENRTGTINYDNISRGLMDAGATLADIRDYRNDRVNKYIPQMTEIARGEKLKAYQDYNPGGYDPRTGRDVYQQGFEGVIGKKGGSIKNKKTKAPTGGHKIDISDFQNLIKLAGLNKK